MAHRVISRRRRQFGRFRGETDIDCVAVKEPDLQIRARPNYRYAFFLTNTALILSNNSIFAPCLRMMIDCCATDSELFQAQ